MAGAIADGGAATKAGRQQLHRLPVQYCTVLFVSLNQALITPSFHTTEKKDTQRVPTTTSLYVSRASRNA